MRGKKIIIFLLCCVFSVLSGCSEPETEDSITQVSVQTEKMSDLNAQQEEQGRFVRCTFETPEEISKDIEMQAVVSVPESVIEEGEFDQTLPTVEQIEEMFTDGQKMEPDSSDFWNEHWSMEPDENSEYAFKMTYYTTSRMGHFQNSEAPELASYPYTDETCQDEAMANKMQELTEQAETVYESVGMRVKYSERYIGMDDGKYMVFVTEVSCLDGVPLVWDTYNFVTNGCFIGEGGVSSMTFAGSFAKKNTRKVSVISVNDLLDIVKEKAEAGEFVSGEIITSITLAYYLDYGSHTFYPVWCLSGDFIEICINAQTGEIVR